MSGESKDSDYKLSYDPADGRAKLDLAKNLVAMANSGGGRIIIGRDEIKSPGISKQTAAELDSAKVADAVGNCVTPAQVHLSHSLEKLPNGKLVTSIEIEAAEIPLVMAKDGVWKGSDPNTDKPLFLRGDIWVRHSSKTERISYEDVRAWIARARRAEKEQILDRITTLASLPEGASIEIVSPSGLPIDSPLRLLESAGRRRERDPDHLLSADDLIWVFVHRHGLRFSETDLRILIASALRRSATLFWWLAEADDDPGLVIQELLEILDAADRDKSDAASRITELAAVYTDSSTSRRLLRGLKNSKYKHFRSAADAWPGKRNAKARFAARMIQAKHLDKGLMEYSEAELEEIASGLADALSREKRPFLSRKLADVNRAIWAKKSRHSSFMGFNKK